MSKKQKKRIDALEARVTELEQQMFLLQAIVEGLRNSRVVYTPFVQRDDLLPPPPYRFTCASSGNHAAFTRLDDDRATWVKL